MAALLAASPRIAQGDAVRDRAAARSAAESGADAIDDGKYERAVELFNSAEQLVHAPTHLLFIARSLVKLGRVVEAREVYLRIVNEQLAPNAPKAFKAARTEASDEIGDVEGRVAYVTVIVRGKDASRATLKIDEAEISGAAQDVPLPIDPGRHVFCARAGALQSDEHAVDLREGDKVSLVLTLPDPAPSTSEASPETSGARTAADGATSARRVVAYASFGLGAVGAGVGTYFLVSSMNLRGQANQAYACNATANCSESEMANVHHYDHEANVARTRATVAYALGAAGLATSVVLLVTEPGAGRSGWIPLRDVRVAAGFGSITASGRF